MEVKAKSLSIMNGPKIRHLSDHDVIMYAEFKGTGVVRCTLYNMPNLANYTDAVSFVIAERDKLKVSLHSYIPYLYVHACTYTRVCYESIFTYLEFPILRWFDI